jgi:O-antigen/teichoic acid export membrane protein
LRRRGVSRYPNPGVLPDKHAVAARLIKNMPEKRSIFRSILRGTGLYLIALVASRVASILLLPVSTRYLTPGDYGALDLIDQVNIVLSLLLGGGFGLAFSFFYFEDASPESRREVVGTALCGAFLIGFISGAFGFVFARQISIAVFSTDRYANYLRMPFATMPLNFLLEAGFSWLRIEDRVITFVGFTFARILIVSTGTVFLLGHLHLGMLGVLWTTTGSVAILAVVLTLYCVNEAKPRFNGNLLKRILRYSLPLGSSGIAMFFIHFGDRFILPHYRPLSELGLYGLAYKIAMLLSFIYASFHTYWSTQVFEIVRRDDGDMIFSRTFTYVTLVLSFSTLALMVSCRPILGILAAPAFRGAAAIVPLILAAYYMRAVGDYFRCLFLVAKRPAYDAACNWFGAVVCLAGYFLLIPGHGMWGAASATLIAFCVISVISVIGAYKLHRFQIEKARLAKVMTSLAIPTTAYFFFPVVSVAGQIVWGIVLLCSFPLLLLLLRFPTESEKQLPMLGYRKVAGWAGVTAS